MANELRLPIDDFLLNQLEEAILLVQKNGKILKANPSALSILNMNLEDVENTFLKKHMNLDLNQTKQVSNNLIKLKNNKGILIDLKLIDVNESMYCLIMKESALHQKTNEIKKNFGNLINLSSEGFIIFDGLYIIDCDLEIATMFGYEIEEIKNKSLDHLIIKGDNEQLKPLEDFHGNSQELIGIKKDGSSFPIQIIDKPYLNNETNIRVAIIKDISERVEHEERLEYMAYFDELTDLPNKNYFIKVLKDAIHKNKDKDHSLAVFFIDLDYFKEINETLGYDVGDKLLEVSGHRLKSFQTIDTFISRVGGDEFLILQKNITDESETTSLAENLISAFRYPVTINGYEVFTSISIGISMFPENGDNADDLIKHAISAMYVIKENNRNDYNFFESSISEKFKKMLTIERDLRKAMRNDEFELHYQPQKSLILNKVVGMEALLRWNHPQKGYIPPMDFIPIAEKTGLIVDIGDWVLREACKQNKRWQEAGYEPIIVSVNLSAKQFHQQNLVEKIEVILKETQLEAKYLELEITESMAMTNEHYILKTMHRLRSLGVNVSIDDFGTGFSSLKYLSEFPITKLKIDQMFMNEKRKQNRAIVKSIIHMSRSLGIKVIAEGVETNEQLEFLKQEKCDEIQGFLFCKPLPAQKLNGFLYSKL